MPRKPPLKPPSATDHFLRDLEKEEARVRKKIDELKSELRSIERLKFRRRQQIYGEELGQPLTSRNVDKVLFESIIIELLKSKPSGMRTSAIFKTISAGGYDLNYNTLRSYIARLRDVNKIKKSGGGYNWIVAEDKQP